ncbi:glycosyltransferase [Virgibacillus sp. SK37]|uniref:glycosyltransferase n=1 Tax=Virgibacillus sp. SK37 TaxID=403957 RepID=UPI0011AAF315|nr:glycosyltransferase [Virgibacillus sp. SK37]
MEYTKNDCDIFFTTESIPLKFGGLTRAMFRRAYLFSKRFNNEIQILTFKYSLELDEIKDYLNQEKFTNDKVRVINMYDFLSELESNKKDGNIEEISIDRHAIKESIENGTVKEFKGKNNTLRKKEYLQNGKLILIEEYNNFGDLIRLRKFNQGYLASEYFYRSDQSIYMIKEFDSTNKSKVKEILLLNKNQNVFKRFKSHRNLQMFFMERKINEHKKTYLINDSRKMDELIINFNKKPIKKLFVIHSTHLRPPYDVFSTVRLGNRYLFNNIGLADGIVFLTEHQKKDVVERYGERPTYNVIPHFIDKGSKEKIDKKLDTRFVVVSRLHEEKQLDHIIRAFKLVDDAGKSFVLDIFGMGKEKDKLEEMISELSLQNKVKIHGFTENPSKEFSNSIGSILTSKYEGFGLTILESLVNGCPVIAYNLKYGPSDMIEHGVNGYLVEPNNITELAETIKGYIALSNQEKNNMYMNASRSAAVFSEEVFLENWKKAFEKADYYSRFRYTVAKKEDIKNKLEYIYFDKNGLNLQISTSVVNKQYKTILQDLKEVLIEVNDKQWQMKREKQSNKEKVINSLTISFESLKSCLEYGDRFHISYYVNLDNIKNKAILKYELENNLVKKNIFSFDRDIYTLSNLDDLRLQLERKKVKGFKGWMKYWKYSSYFNK